MTYLQQYLLVTPGEPAGIGPDLAIKLAQSPQKKALVFIADPDVLAQRAILMGLDITIQQINSDQKLLIAEHYTGKKQLLCLALKVKNSVNAGILDVANSEYVIKTLDKAIALSMSTEVNKQFAAWVTGPIHKGIINDAGYKKFTGHTEYLAEQSNTKQVIMMLATEGLRVALVTTHLPIKEISQHIKQSLIENILALLNLELKNKFGINKPQIYVCGLNPHAGENGHLGHEEIDSIIPAITWAQEQQIAAFGPIPADTVFTPRYMQKADVILAMYHDQGLSVLKYKGFGQAVNITLGLPFIRVSVDHGTALDLAGKKDELGLLDAGSMNYAIKTALSMMSLKTN